MNSTNTPRVMAAAKEFNIGKDTLIDFLISKGFAGESLNATSRLSEEMYKILQSEFQFDKYAHAKAMQIELAKGFSTNEEDIFKLNFLTDLVSKNIDKKNQHSIWVTVALSMQIFIR